MSYKINSLEFQLALSCSALDKNISLILNDLQNSATWNESRFFSFLERHRIVELASRILVDEFFFSEEFKLKLKSIEKNNQLRAIHSQFIQNQLQSYLTLNRIDSIFLKGTPIAYLYYGDIGKRNIFDIDVWVGVEHLEKVTAFLNSIGYYKWNDQFSFNSIQLQYLKLSSHHEIFYCRENPQSPIIELHWKIRNSLGNFMFDPASEKQKLIDVEIGGTTFSVFNHIDQFIFLSVHGAEHGWFRLKWLADIFHLVKTIDLDWSAVISRAQELRSIKEIKIAAYFLQKYYKIDLHGPYHMLELNFFDRLRIQYIESFIVYENEYCDTRFEKIKNGIYLLSLNRLVYISKELLLKNLTRPSDWLLLNLPSYLFFLYFPLRPFLWVYRRFKY
jgi:hypothetical protein